MIVLHSIRTNYNIFFQNIDPFEDYLLSLPLRLLFLLSVNHFISVGLDRFFFFFLLVYKRSGTDADYTPLFENLMVERNSEPALAVKKKLLS